MKWNPFQLGGPGFVAFYLALMAVTLIVLRRAMRARETAATPPAPRFDDPYLIAWLRGGDLEAVRVAIVSLVDRGLLRAEGDRVALADPKAIELVRRDLERALLRFFRSPGSADAAKNDPQVRAANARYRQLLDQHGLVAGHTVFVQRFQTVGVAAAVLLGVAAARFGQALAQGRHNLGFLTVLTLISAVILVAHWARRRTFAGDAVVSDLKTLFKRLKDRASTLRAGTGASEVSLLAAVFGLTALPAVAFPFVEKLYPAKDSSGSGGSSCGSSSSCSSGSSCGGGCGGGGCGGD